MLRLLHVISVGLRVIRKPPGRLHTTLAAILLIAGAATGFPTHATTLDVPGTYATIQAGINAAASGDTVLVAPGTYVGAGNVNLLLTASKDIILLSSGGRDVTIIDCEAAATGLTVSTPGFDRTVDGFTIRNAVAFDFNGAGAHISSTNFAFNNCAIESCLVIAFSIPGGGQGGGVYIDGGTGSFTDCIIRDNSAQDFGVFIGPAARGGGVCVIAGDVDFMNCEISGNSIPTPSAPPDIGAGAGVYVESPTLTEFIGCTIFNNSIPGAPGGGLYINGSANVIDCEIYDHTDTNVGGGAVVGFFANNPQFVNTSFYNNAGGLFGVGPFTATDCDFTGNFLEAAVRTGEGGLSVIETCVIAGNSSVGIEVTGETLLDRCLITGNAASGILQNNFGADPLTLQECTVAGNLVFGNGGGIRTVSGGAITVLRSIVFGNIATGAGDDVYGPNLIHFECSTVDTSGVENSVVTYGADNVFTPPGFCAPEPAANAPTTAGDYTLASDSPAAAAHSPCGSQIGVLGVGCSANTILSISDVGNDQGRRVRVKWERSTWDAGGSALPILNYSLWRKVLPGFANKPAQVPPRGIAAPEGDWDFVEMVPAGGQSTYAALAETLCDSTVAGGQCFSTFFMRAHTASPTTFFDSDPDSGYSIDNLAPSVPLNTMATYGTGSGNQLVWDDNLEADLQYYRVYRDSDPDFVPSMANFAAGTPTSDWTDPDNDAPGVYYKVTAVDFAGNESAAAAFDLPTDVSDLTTLPTRFVLHRAVPNPFNPSTTIVFDVAQTTHVTLRIHDVSGRLVRTLVDATLERARHRVQWDGLNDRGQRAATGIYFYKLRAADFTDVKKMVMMK